MRYLVALLFVPIPALAFVDNVIAPDDWKEEERREVSIINTHFQQETGYSSAQGVMTRTTWRRKGPSATMWLSQFDDQVTFRHETKRASWFVGTDAAGFDAGPWSLQWGRDLSKFGYKDTTLYYTDNQYTLEHIITRPRSTHTFGYRVNGYNTPFYQAGFNRAGWSFGFGGQREQANAYVSRRAGYRTYVQANVNQFRDDTIGSVSVRHGNHTVSINQDARITYDTHLRAGEGTVTVGAGYGGKQTAYVRAGGTVSLSKIKVSASLQLSNDDTQPTFDTNWAVSRHFDLITRYSGNTWYAGCRYTY